MSHVHLLFSSYNTNSFLSVLPSYFSHWLYIINWIRAKRCISRSSSGVWPDFSCCTGQNLKNDSWIWFQIVRCWGRFLVSRKWAFVLKNTPLHVKDVAGINLEGNLKFFLRRTFSLWTPQELGLLEGTPVGTSLIDAHAGGVGVLESMPASEALANGLYDLFTMLVVIFQWCRKLSMLTWKNTFMFQLTIEKRYVIAWY